MDFQDSPQEADFRRRARDWLADNAPRYTPPADASEADVVALMRGWQAAKYDAGFDGYGMPEAFGGKPGTMIESVIFKHEEARYPIAQGTMPYMTIGVLNAVPVMIHHAGRDLAERLIVPTMRGELVWCQLFSEPGAGNDVAGIRTRAERDGDDWVVNGQKLWSSGAHLADWALLLVRTDPTVPKHKGLTFLLMDMKTPGIEVRPLKQITGRSEFNEVFFNDVRIPDACRAGGAGEGWKVVITALLNERLGALSGSGAAFGGDVLAPLIRLARKAPGDLGGRAIDDPRVRARIADYHAVLAGLEHFAARMVTTLSRGSMPGPEASMGKVVQTRWLQDMAAFGLDLAGPANDCVPGARDEVAVLADSFLGAVGYRQGGGTEDINKSIIAERVLGMPADPRVDKDIPFNQLPPSV